MYPALVIPPDSTQSASARPDRVEHLGTDSLQQVRTHHSAPIPADTTSLNRADSTQLNAADSTVLTGFATDSIGFIYHGSTAPQFRYTKDPAEVFGPASTTVAAPILQEKAIHPLTENSVFHGFVLLLAALYILLLHRHTADIIALFSRMFHTSPTGNRFSDEQGGLAFSHFLHIIGVAGTLFVGMLVVKTSDVFIPVTQTEIFTEKMILGMSLLATVIFAIFGAYQFVLLRLAGALTLSQPLTSQLIQLKRIYFALVVVVISPTLLLCALCPPKTGIIWFYAILIELAIIALLYLGKSLNLFLSKKVSILHWFLYLCIVEIFPISLLYLIATR